MKKFFIGVQIWLASVGFTLGLILPVILGYALLFSGFRTAGLIVYGLQVLWVFPFAVVFDRWCEREP